MPRIVLPIIRDVQASGLTSLRDIAAALNVRGVRTARGGSRRSTRVRNLHPGAEYDPLRLHGAA